jgi:hypothetical protein
MAFPVAAGTRDMSASAMSYIPVRYSTKYLVKFFNKCTVGDITNHDHEQEIKQFGDTVTIRSLPDITINTYYKGQSLVYEQPVATPTSLLINKGKSWSFSTNDVDDIQTDLKDYVDQWMDVAMKQMAEAVDTDLLGNIYANCDAANFGTNGAGKISANIAMGVASGTAVTVTKNDILEKLVDMGQVLDEQNVPKENRWVVIPSWFAGMMKKSDLKSASLMGDDTSVMRNGKLGKVDDLNIYVSNLLSTGTDSGTAPCTYIPFGTSHGITFAAQITKNEHVVNPNDFGVLHRGLMVYGYKTVKAVATGCMFAKAG